MTRLLMHLALATTVVLVPSIRVFCSGSCPPDDPARGVAAAVPDCHDRDLDPSGSAPSDDGCRHAGEDAWSSLSATTKSPGVGGAVNAVGIVPVARTAAPSARVTGHRAAIAVTTAQSLGLFLTPLRI